MNTDIRYEPKYILDNTELSDAMSWMYDKAKYSKNIKREIHKYKRKFIQKKAEECIGKFYAEIPSPNFGAKL